MWVLDSHTVKVCKKPFRELNLPAINPSWILEAFDAGILYSQKYNHPVMPFGLIPVIEIYNLYVLLVDKQMKKLSYYFLFNSFYSALIP